MKKLKIIKIVKTQKRKIFIKVFLKMKKSKIVKTQKRENIYKSIFKNHEKQKRKINQYIYIY